jgi:DNA-binding MarR family transcriptional regulator
MTRRAGIALAQCVEKCGRDERVDGASAVVYKLLRMRNISPVPTLEPDIRDDVGQVIETIIYLYTESRRITKELAQRAQLTGPQLTVVKILETIGDLSLTGLSERIRAQNSTVTGIIDRMERDGLVVRERSKEDRRVVKIRLTPKGEELARSVPLEPMEIFRGALGSLTKEEMQDLLRILLKVSRKVKSIVRKEVSQ